MPTIRRFPRPFVALLAATGGIAVAGSSQMIVKPAETLRYVVEYPDQQTSPSISIVKGNPAKTPVSMLIRMKKSVLPMHSHSADYQAVVIEGTMKHWAKAENEAQAPRLGPGSWWYQPGKQVHTDACLEEECVIYVHNTGKLDTIPDR
jgi:quercetin dioxygenase-like cupin family protein